MTISLRVNNEETDLIKSYAAAKGISVSELIRESVIERIENEIDLKLYNEALNEFNENPVMYSLDEVTKELGLK